MSKKHKDVKIGRSSASVRRSVACRLTLPRVNRTAEKWELVFLYWLWERDCSFFKPLGNKIFILLLTNIYFTKSFCTRSVFFLV